MVGMLILTFSDAFAAIFGRIYGKIRIPYSSKTILGSTAFFLSTIIILFIFSKENNFIHIL
ncbi:hypothetical protein LDC_1326 [sediment metagenome]|uniref:Phosphatidate cytidylyltransferase n=1 Tax=sediment metagenome TaxID=749907 RepID=D9PIG8_9ZZZZ